jgi:hypothetical protein
VQRVAGKLPELDDVKLHFRPGHLEVQARLRGPERAPLTFKVAFDGDGDSLAVYLLRRAVLRVLDHARRAPGSAGAEAVKAGAALPDVERRGANGFSTRLLPALVEQAAVARGYKMPRSTRRGSPRPSSRPRGSACVSRRAACRLRLPDEELLLTLEGARAFAEAEELLAQGKARRSPQAYLRLGDATEAHPFAVERLLTPARRRSDQAHELALDVAASLARRRDRSATAVWAEAVVRERRGEFARASERYLALCNLSRKHGRKKPAPSSPQRPPPRVAMTRPADGRQGPARAARPQARPPALAQGPGARV